MPRNVNPASITVGAGIAPQGTVEDNSLRHPQRDIEPLRAHLLDPNNAHMASAIGIVDAGGYYASTDVEGALQEIGAGGAAGRHNGLVIGGTFTSGPGLLTLDTPTVVLIGGVAASFGGATVALPPSVTRYVWIDATTSTLTASAVLPPVSSEPILIAKVTTDGGANITSSQDARFFVANLDRKVDYTLRSDGSAVNDASEACFVTLDAALFWLENYVATAQERKALVLVRGEHIISSTVAVPSGIPNIEFRGEGAATFATGASLNPVFNVSGTSGLTFTGITFRCDHAGSIAIRTATGALACSNVTVQNCRFTVGGSTWNDGVLLNAATPATQQGHRVLGSQFTVNNNGVYVASAVDCVVRDCTFAGTSVVGSAGVTLLRVAGTGENCLVDNVRTNDFGFPFSTTTQTTTLRKCTSTYGGVLVGGERSIVDGCSFTGITEPMGLEITINATGTVVSNTTIASTKVWAAPENPAGIASYADGVLVTGCSISGFYNVAGSNGAGFRSNGPMNNKVSTTDISNCHTGVELLGVPTGTVEACSINAKVRGIFSDAASPGTRVLNTSVVLDSTVGLSGVVVAGAGPTVVGCQLANPRPFNAYLVGEVPAGILCGSNAANGPYTITGCTINNFYNSVGQVGGGVVYKGIMSGLTVSGCSFNDCGVIGDGAASIANTRITECLFDTPSAALQRTGVNLVVATTVSDVIVSGCTFSATSTNTGFMVDVSATTVARLTVANCTYSVGAAPGGSQRFVNIAAAAGGDAIIEGNTVEHPTVNTLGPVLATGLNTLLVTNNVLRSNGFSLSKALETDAKAVNFVGNTVTNMNGIVLVANTGTLPVLTATGNTFDCGNNTAAYGVQAVSSNGAVTLDSASIVGNTFSMCLHAAEFVNTLGTLTVSNFKFAENTVTACRYGLTTDADSVTSFAVCSNEFRILNYALYNSNVAALYETVAVDGNIIRQQGFVAPLVSLALVMLAGNGIKGASLSRNLINHAGDVGAILLLFMGGAPPEDVAMDENIVRNEGASAQPALRLTFTVNTALLGAVANNISASRNKVNHFGGGFAAVRVALGFTGVTSGVRNIHADDNEVVAEQDNAANNGVEVIVNGAGGLFNTSVQNVSMCRNNTTVYGAGVRCDLTDITAATSVSLCNNTTLLGNVGSQGAVVFESLYTGAVPAGAAVSNVRICGNYVSNTNRNAAITLRTTATVMNAAVDDNVLANVGSAGGDPNEGSVYLFMANTTAYPSRDAATNVSVSRNKVSSSNVAVPTFGKAAVLVYSTGALVTEGKNITVDDNEVFNHGGDAIAVALGYDSLQNLSVSGNKIRTVSGRAIYVSGMDNINGLNVSHNVIQRALNAGSVVGDGTIEVDTDNGNGFVFTGNRLSAASRRGIFVFGGLASSLLEGITVTGNMVDFTNGAELGEEGIYLFWEHALSDITITGNTVREAETGIYVDGGLPSSVIGTTSEVTRVTVTGNTVTAKDYGVWVSNHTVGSGFGAVTLNNVVVSNNAITASAANLVFGVLVDTLSEVLERVTVTGNTVNMGASSKGIGVCVDTNDATPTSVTIEDNSVVYGDIGVSLLMTETRLTNASVSRNNIDTMGSRGVWVDNMNSLRNVSVDENKVQTVTPSGSTGYGIHITGLFFTTDSTNVSISGNSINATAKSGILFQALRATGSPAIRNLSICRNKVGNWHDGAGFAFVVHAIDVQTCTSVTNPHPLYNLDISQNSCVKFGGDYVGGFNFSLDEETQQVTFAHNQVRLDAQANTGAMAWLFRATGGAAPIPKDFVFTGNQFRRTNGVTPTYVGATGDFATFYGNIGSAANFWTTFATNWTTYRPAAPNINVHNIDNGT